MEQVCYEGTAHIPRSNPNPSPNPNPNPNPNPSPNPNPNPNPNQTLHREQLSGIKALREAAAAHEVELYPTLP